ncbi:MAG: hypothetical protein LBO09_01905 [Candidatus Peribacteria bacterium]|jgi:hypothetical protein|nr:hypothetical protein [Candidatus Peribacteria bacterium]
MQELNTHTSIPNHEVIFDSVVGLKKLINARLKSSMDNQLSLLQQEFEELKQNNLQDTLDYFANEGMDISEVVKVTLDEKYKYPNPLEKAKTIHVIGVDKKSGEWLVKNVDSPNLESGIGADC